MSVGFDPPMTHFSSVTSAVLIYLLALLFCYVLYQLSKIFLPGFIQEYVLDFFKTLAFCTYCFGHGVVRNAHGHLGYILCMVPLNTASVLIFNLGDGTPLTVYGPNIFEVKFPHGSSLSKCRPKSLLGFALGNLDT